MKNKQHLILGAKGEDIALKYLCAKGMDLVQRNWKTRLGEADLIMRDGEEVVLVEVKTRRYSKFAVRHIFDNVSNNKKRKLLSLLGLYLRTYKKRFAYTPPHRIDLVGVILNSRGEADVKYLKGAL